MTASLLQSLGGHFCVFDSESLLPLSLPMAYPRLNAPSTRLRIPTSPSSVNIAQPSFRRIPFPGFPFFVVSHSTWSFRIRLSDRRVTGLRFTTVGAERTSPGRPAPLRITFFKAFVRAYNRLPYMAAHKVL